MSVQILCLPFVQKKSANLILAYIRFYNDHIFYISLSV